MGLGIAMLVEPSGTNRDKAEVGGGERAADEMAPRRECLYFFFLLLYLYSLS